MSYIPFDNNDMTEEEALNNMTALERQNYYKDQMSLDDSRANKAFDEKYIGEMGDNFNNGHTKGIGPIAPNLYANALGKSMPSSGDMPSAQPDPVAPIAQMVSAPKKSPLTEVKPLDQNAGPSPIAPETLDRLSQARPDLVDAYRKKLAGADANLADAQKTQHTGDLINIAGKFANDLGNSNKRDVILKHDLEHQGTDPTIMKANRPEYDGQVLNDLTARGVQRAKDSKLAITANYDTERKLREEDPKSAESASAREYLKKLVPNSSAIPNLDNMSAAQIEKAAPGLYKAWDDTQKHAEDKHKVDIEHADRMAEIGRKGAIEKAAKLPSVEQQKLNSNAAMGLKGIQDMRAALEKGDNTFSLIGDNDFTASQRRASEAFGRMQSGGAINKDEEARFIDMGPRMGDSKSKQMDKLATQQAEFEARLREAGVDPQTAVQSRSSPQPVSEVRRVTPDGRTAVFNGQTKEFVRYE